MDIAMWCVFGAFLLIYVTRLPVVIASHRQEGYVELANPREQQARLKGSGSRAQAAHQNTIEAFAPFAAAVLISRLAGGSTHVADWLAVCFIGLRVLYVVAYLADLNPWRTVIWTAGTLCIVGIFLSSLF